MEEQKQKAKTVAMNTVNSNDGNPHGKYSYEELSGICANLAQQNQKLISQLQSQTNVFTRLEFLFRVIEASGRLDKWHFSDKFMESCINEIEVLLTIPKDSEYNKK